MTTTQPTMDPGTLLHPTHLTDTIESIVSTRLSRLEHLLTDGRDKQDFKLAALEATLLAMSGDQAARDVMAEKAAKAREKKERRERESERGELVEAIREMVLEEMEKEKEKEDMGEEPLVLRDCVGRVFVFPFEEGRGWKRFAELIRQAFDSVEGLNLHVNNGHYDILDPRGRVVLPSIWDKVVEPGWEVSMHLWPMNQEQIEDKRAVDSKFRNRKIQRRPMGAGRNCSPDSYQWESDEEDISIVDDDGVRERLIRPKKNISRKFDDDEGAEITVIDDESEGEPYCPGPILSGPALRRDAALDGSRVNDDVAGIAVRGKDPPGLNAVCSDLIARIKQLEKDLFAEQQLSATLDEALVDHEGQTGKARDETQAWKKNYLAANRKLAHLMQQRGSNYDGDVMAREPKTSDVAELAIDRSGKKIVHGKKSLGGLADGEGFDDWEEAVVED